MKMTELTGRGFRACLALVALLTVAACGAGQMSGPNATPEEAAAAAYRSSLPPSITLYTMINNRTNGGAHTSIMINAPSQRVVFDPAGSVRFQSVPEIDDVLYGITPDVEQAYESAHARSTYRVKIQQKQVPPEVAERALRLVQANGPVSAAACTSATSGILRQLPGFETLPSVLFPTKLMEAFAELPGVTTRELREDDEDDKDLAVKRIELDWQQTKNP
ncbi:hypothetical protein [Sagittula sp. MA-2]|uniref:hypothetical protein n=1 Tax=Sagittula sp. MA-2 TaxID=3048007 RepID=UPI0024C35592|nr:hypothetical protein [Sagittula sp. MA-2]WHZ34603.1 hypothetical protein QNI11_18455 [Sagittula sp. MA-2]